MAGGNMSGLKQGLDGAALGGSVPVFLARRGGLEDVVAAGLDQGDALDDSRSSAIFLSWVIALMALGHPE